MTNLILSIALVLRFAVRWTIRLALLGLLIGWLAGCTTVGSDYRSPRSTAAVNEALRDFSMHAVQQRPTCEWYPVDMSMRCN